MIEHVVQTLASGQPRRWADHLLHVRVTFTDDGQPYDGFNSDEQVREKLRSIPCGFNDDPPKEWHDSKLKSLSKVAPGVWEFQITTPYTD